MQSKGSNLGNMLLATAGWMVVPALIFFYYYFVWLGDQVEAETHHKLRSLEEMVLEYQKTVSALEQVTRTVARNGANCQDFTDPKINGAAYFRNLQLNVIAAKYEILRQRCTIANGHLAKEPAEHLSDDEILQAQRKLEEGSLALEKETAHISATNSGLALSIAHIEATWPSSDIGKLFENHIRPPGLSRNPVEGSLSQADFEGVLILDKNAHVIQAFGSQAAAIVDLDFIRDGKESFLALAKTESSVAEEAANLEFLRLGALSRSSVWTIDIGATTYKLYIRPIESIDQKEKPKAGKGPEDTSLHFIVGLEREASFLASVARMPVYVQAGVALLIVTGLLAIPTIRLVLMNDMDSISLHEAATIICTSLVLISIITISGFTLAHRSSLREKTDTIATTIAQKLKTEFRTEIANAIDQIDTTAKSLILQEYTPINLMQEASPKQMLPSINAGWISSKPHPYKYKHPEFREFFALDKKGNNLGVLVHTRKEANKRKRLRGRSYFQHALKGELWSFPLVLNAPPSKHRRVFIERIISRTEGGRITAVSLAGDDQNIIGKNGPIPHWQLTSKQNPTDKAKSTIAANNNASEVAKETIRAWVQTRKLKAFWNPILPVGYEFAVIEDNSGRTLYHSRDHRSLVENMYLETDRNKRLLATIGSRQADTLPLTYRDKSVRAVTNPIEGTPWTIIVLYEQTFFDRLLLNSLSISSIGVPAFLASCLVFFLSLAWASKVVKHLNHSPNNRDEAAYLLQQVLWPTKRSQFHYCLVSMGLAAAFCLQLISQYILVDEKAEEQVLLYLNFLPAFAAICWAICLHYSDFADKLSSTVSEKHYEWATNPQNTKVIIRGTLLLGALVIAVMPSRAFLGDVMKEQFSRLDRFTANQALDAYEKRHLDILEAAIWKSNEEAHQNSALNPQEFEVFSEGIHLFKGYDSGIPADIYREDCTASPIDGNETTAGTVSSFLVDKIALGSRSAVALKPFANTSAEDGSWKVCSAGSDLRFGKTSELVGGKLSISTNPISREINTKAPHFLIRLIALGIFLAVLFKYLKVLEKHLFGGDLEEIRFNQTFPVSNIKQASKNMVFVSPLPFGTPLLKKMRIPRSLIHTPETIKAADTIYTSRSKPLVIHHIVPTLLHKDKRLTFLKNLERLLFKTPDQRNVIVFCKFELCDFFAHPERYIHMLQTARQDTPKKAANSDEENQPKDQNQPNSREEAIEILGFNNDEHARWVSLLSHFETHWIGQYQKESKHLWNTNIGQISETKEETALVDRYSSTFQDIWSHRTFRQKLALYHMADNKLVSSAATPTIQELMKLGLVSPKRPYVIANDSFRAFIGQKITFGKLAEEVKQDRNAWHKIRGPLFLALGLIILVIVVMGGKNLLASVEAMLGLFGAATALLFRFLPMGR